jgi:hypothetical protein
MTFELVAIGRGVFGLSMGLLLLLPLLVSNFSLTPHTHQSSPHINTIADNHEVPTADAMCQELERLGGEGTYNSTFTRNHANVL